MVVVDERDISEQEMGGWNGSSWAKGGEKKGWQIGLVCFFRVGDIQTRGTGERKVSTLDFQVRSSVNP